MSESKWEDIIGNATRDIDTILSSVDPSVGFKKVDSPLSHTFVKGSVNQFVKSEELHGKKEKETSDFIVGATELGNKIDGIIKRALS